MKVGGKRPRGRPTLRWMDRVWSDMGGKRPRGGPRLGWMDRLRSNMKEYQPDPKVAQSWRSIPERDKIGKGSKLKYY